MNINDFIKPDSKYYNNNGAENVFNFLADPTNTHNLIVFSNVQLPALSGLVNQLENLFLNDIDFPLHDFRNRQLVGKMVKFILDFYGYTPNVGGLDDRAKLRIFSNASKFKTASIYALTNEPRLELEIQSKIIL